MLSRAAPLLLALLLPLAAAFAAPPAPPSPALGTPVPQPDVPNFGWLNEGHRKKSAGDLPGALHCYEQAVAMDPSDFSAYWFRGEARLEAKDYHGAEADYSMVILLLPNDPAGYIKRGYVRELLYAHPLALEDREAALALKPKDRDLLVSRANALIQTGQYREAALQFNELLAGSQDTLCLTNRAVARIGLGDYYGAISDCDAVLAREPTSTYAFQIRGLAKYHLGLFKAARHDFDSMVGAADPSGLSQDERLIRRSLLLEMIGDFPAALQDCEAAAALPNPENQSGILTHRSILRQRAGLPADEAIARTLEQWQNEADVMIGRYLLGRVSETDLLQAADQADRSRFPGYHRLARYFAGMTNLLQGQEARGLELLRQCAVFPSLDLEYLAADAEVKRHAAK